MALIRVCTTIFGSKPSPSRAAAGWTACADITSIILVVFGGIFLMLAYGQNGECSPDNCNTFHPYPAGPWQDKAAYLLYAVSQVVTFSILTWLRETRCPM